MTLKEIINNPSTVLIDVREPFEYAMGNVKDSINIPLGQIPYKLDELKAMNKSLVLFCASGNRSGQATYFLQAKGFENVFNGGSWREVDTLKFQTA